MKLLHNVIHRLSQDRRPLSPQVDNGSKGIYAHNDIELVLGARSTAAHVGKWRNAVRHLVLGLNSDFNS